MDNSSTSGQRKRMKLIQVAIDEILKIRTEQRIATAQKTNIFSSVKYIIKIGDEVFTYSEREKKWIPNPRVIDIDGKHV